MRDLKKVLKPFALASNNVFLTATISLGWVLLLGRFDLSGKLGTNAYWLNAFMFSILLLSIMSYPQINVSRPKTRLFLILFTTVFTFPYHFFGIQTFYSSHPRTYPVSRETSEQLVLSLMEDLTPSNFPYKSLLYAILFLSLLIFRKLLKEVFFFASITLLLTWRYTSFSSPYSWVPSMERKSSENYTYVVSQFSDGSGFVNADDPVHYGVTALFQGFDGSAALIRRPLSNYLISNFSYITNQYYAWVALNFVFWVVMLVALNQFALFCNFGPYSRFYLLGIFSLSPLLLSYFGQSSAYFMGIITCTISFLILFIHHARNSISRKDSVFVTLLFTLTLLTYDSSPWLLALVICIILIFGRKLVLIYLKGLFFSHLLYIGFRYILVPLLGLNVDQGNEQILGRLLSFFNNETGASKPMNLYLGLITIFSNLTWLVLTGLSLGVGVVLFLGLFFPLLRREQSLMKTRKSPHDQSKSLNNTYVLNIIILVYFTIAIVLQVLWHFADLDHIGLIPRVNGTFLMMLNLASAIGLSGIERSHAFLSRLLVVFVILLISLFALGIFPEWRIFFYYLVQGRWIALGFL